MSTPYLQAPGRAPRSQAEDQKQDRKGKVRTGDQSRSQTEHQSMAEHPEGCRIDSVAWTEKLALSYVDL